MRASSAKKPIPGKRTKRSAVQVEPKESVVAALPTMSSDGEPLRGYERTFCARCWTMFVVPLGQAAPCTCPSL
jgi:hypothetical protein